MAHGAMGIGPRSKPPQTHPTYASGEKRMMAHGAMGIRTPDLLNAIEALYQLSYDPERKQNRIAKHPHRQGKPLACEISSLRSFYRYEATYLTGSLNCPRFDLLPARPIGI